MLYNSDAKYDHKKQGLYWNLITFQKKLIRMITCRVYNTINVWQGYRKPSYRCSLKELKGNCGLYKSRLILQYLVTVWGHRILLHAPIIL